MVKWLRIRLPEQGTWVQSPVSEDSTCCGATKPVRHNKRSHRKEKLMHPQLEQPPLATTREGPKYSNDELAQLWFLKKKKKHTTFLFLATWLKNDNKGYLEMGAWTLTPVEQKKQPRDED